MISRFAKSFIAIIIALLLITTITFIHPPSRSYIDPWTGELFGEGGVERMFHGQPPNPAAKGAVGNAPNGASPVVAIPGATGDVIMPKLGNATAKAALGRATWKLLHTITLRYPEKPTPDERDALSSYFHLSSRLYPCGECAAEFQQLLKSFPPQTSSRRAAALWLCSVHNEVNKRLKKPIFDCAHLDSEYDCGCGDEPIGKKKDPMDLESDPSEDDITGAKMIKGAR